MFVMQMFHFVVLNFCSLSLIGIIMKNKQLGVGQLEKRNFNGVLPHSPILSRKLPYIASTIFEPRNLAFPESGHWHIDIRSRCSTTELTLKNPGTWEAAFH